MDELNQLFKELNQDIAQEQLRKLGYLDAIEDIQNLIISKLELANSGVVCGGEALELREVAAEIELVANHLKVLAELKYNC